MSEEAIERYCPCCGNVTAHTRHVEESTIEVRGVTVPFVEDCLRCSGCKAEIETPGGAVPYAAAYREYEGITGKAIKKGEA